MNITEVLKETAGRLPDKVGYYFDDRGTTYAEIQRMSEAFAYALHQIGTKKGDRVAIFTLNSMEFITAWFGVVRLGACVIPINIMLKARESRYILENSEASVLIVHQSQLKIVDSFRNELPFLKEIIVIGEEAPSGTKRYSDLVSGKPPKDMTVDCPPDQTATIIYTSGTTGYPKGAMLTHASLYSNVRELIWALHLDEQTVRVSVTPFFHAMGLTVSILAAIMVGATTIVQPRLEFEPFLKANEKHHATVISGAPALHYLLANDPRTEKYDLSSWKVGMSGSAPLPVEVLRRFEEKFKIPMIEAYGLTEVTTVATANPFSGVHKPGSVGLALPSLEVKIFDEQDKEVPTGTIGEIVIRGPSVMKGYYNNPKETAETLRGGWLHTGDVGHIDSDGYVFILDRKKDMIICSGYNVYPREIEELLHSHPAVLEAAVIGAPDPKRGEVPVAFIIVRPGQSVTEEDLVQFCRSNLANYKAVQRVKFLDDFPRNPNRKVLKRELRQML